MNNERHIVYDYEPILMPYNGDATADVGSFC